MSETPNHVGKILISDPFLQGPVFERAVILMVDHTPEGSMGFIINQPTEIRLGQAIEAVQECDFPIYYGGPVDDNMLFFIHTLGDKITKSVEIGEGLYWGGDFEEIIDLIKDDKISQDEIKFFIGYSGWGEQQIESEFEKDSWLVGEFHMSYLFKPQTKDLWNKCLNRTDSDLSLFTKFAHTPSLN